MCSSSSLSFRIPPGVRDSENGYSGRYFLYDHSLYNLRFSRRSERKLLVLDVNGLLAHTIFEANVDGMPMSRRADGHVGRKLVFKRPFCDDFVRFCFDNFDVGIWSSARKSNVEGIIHLLLGDLNNRLLFCWGQSECTNTGMQTLDKGNKPLFLKELRKLWNNVRVPWPRGYYSRENTLLIDDSPYKALKNPPFTAIFPHAYNVNNEDDSSLGSGGDLRNYLEDIAFAPDVQQYVQSKPFGQPVISQDDPNWWFYSQVDQACHRGTLSYNASSRP